MGNPEKPAQVRVPINKGKEYHTPWRVLVGCSSPLLRPLARRRINHLSLWRIASATTDLQLPSHSQGIVIQLLGDRDTCVNNLAKVVTWQRLGRELNSRLLESQANALTITPQGHTLPINDCRRNIFSLKLASNNLWGIKSGFVHDSDLMLAFILHQKHSFVEKLTLTFTFTFKVAFISTQQSEAAATASPSLTIKVSASLSHCNTVI